MGKIGLLLEGGGMKCAYGAGVLDKFNDDNVTFDYVIGVSAGSANGASYLAGQRGRNIRFYTELISDPDYMGIRCFLRNGEMFGIRYIYADLSNEGGKAPLDYEKVLENPAEYYVVATNAITGKPEYFTKTDMKKNDYRAIMCSSAIPAACRPVFFKNRYYFDGGVSDPLPVKKMLEDGCDRIVAILSKPRGYVKKPESFRTFYHLKLGKYPKMKEALDNRHILYTEEQKELYRLEEEGKAFIFAPSAQIKMGTFSTDSKTQEKLYQLGLDDYGELKEGLAAFMAAE
ncbi:MAG: patatin family protein [Eubacterium sp.]|nr:patatin family protein [Eubacterium sp.]